MLKTFHIRYNRKEASNSLMIVCMSQSQYTFPFEQTPIYDMHTEMCRMQVMCRVCYEHGCCYEMSIVDNGIVSSSPHTICYQCASGA